MKIKKICQQCGKEFEVYPSQNKPAIFCSIQCAGKSRQGKPNLKRRRREKRNCIQCNKEFEIMRSMKNKHCSIRCAGKSASKRMTIKISRICEYCKKIFYTIPSCIKNNKAKYCSKKCFNLLRRKRPKKRYKLICYYCQNIFEVNTNHLKRGAKYCSRLCSYLDNKNNLFGGKYKRFPKGNIPWDKGLSKESSNLVKQIAEKRRGQIRPELKGKIVGDWNNKDYLEKVLSGQTFGKGAYGKLSDLDKKVIESKILLFKIKRQLGGL